MYYKQLHLDTALYNWSLHVRTLTLSQGCCSSSQRHIQLQTSEDFLILSNLCSSFKQKPKIQCIKHSDIRTFKNIVFYTEQTFKLVLMPSNATLKAFQLDWGESNNIFPVLLLQKKKEEEEEKCRDDISKN